MPTFWNGAAATDDQLAFLGLHNYGNYTFLQVRRTTARGLALHVQRLRSNGTELFGAAPSENRLRSLMAQAAGIGDCSMRVTLVSSDVDAVLAGSIVQPDVVITVSDQKPSSSVPIAARTVSYQREIPWVKHRATHGLIRHTRAARQAGFDDALFVNPLGHISEGTTWNLCLRAADCWVWPEADVLDGVTQQLMRTAMDAAGVRHERRAVLPADLPHYQAAFSLNASSPAKPLARIDAHCFTSDGAAAVQLEDLWRGIAAEAL